MCRITRRHDNPFRNSEAAAPVPEVSGNPSVDAATDPSHEAGANDAGPVPGATPLSNGDVLRAICASSFGRGDARVDRYLDARGKLVVLALRPDISKFSHAPHIYFGPDGVELLAVPDFPVVPGDPEMKLLLQKKAKLLRGLTPGEVRDCSGYR